MYIKTSRPPGLANPNCLDVFADGGELFLLLENLSTRRFGPLKVPFVWLELNGVHPR
jgi:hypothetical protein